MASHNIECLQCVATNFNSLLDAHERPSANYSVVVDFICTRRALTHFAVPRSLFAHTSHIDRWSHLLHVHQRATTKNAKIRDTYFAVYEQNKKEQTKKTTRNLFKMCCERLLCARISRTRDFIYACFIQSQSATARRVSDRARERNEGREEKKKDQPKSGEAIYF